jgi:hypothetical protein
MAAPLLVSIDPADESTGIPIGSSLVLTFSNSIDVTTVKDYVILFGAAFDQTSGPDSVMYIDKDTGNNPFFLRSPGFKGIMELQTRVVYYDLATELDIGTPVFYTLADELAYGTAGAAHRVYITPVIGALAADVEYTMHVLGDPDVQSTGISSRTVFDTEPNLSNASTDGIVYATGGYTGTVADVVNVEITTGGDIGVARYKWWLTSAGSGSAIREKLTNRRYRELGLGVQVRFSGEDFTAGDVFTIAVQPAERMAASTVITFTTNDGSYSTPPDSPSVPATSTPPSSVIPPLPGSDTSESFLQVEEMTPADGAFNVSKSTHTIEILFSEQLAAGSVTNDTVRVWKLPALGYYGGERPPQELAKKLTVSGQTITVEI